MHVPILRTYNDTDSSVPFMKDTALLRVVLRGGLGQRHVTQFQSWELLRMNLEARPALLPFSAHLTTAVSRIYLHRVTSMQSLGGLAR